MKNVQKIHEYIDQNPRELYNTAKLSDLFRQYLQEDSSILDGERSTLELEYMICSFLLEENEAKPRFSWTDPADGIQRSFPHITQINEQHLELIKERFKNTQSYLYKAVIGHLLYVLGHKHTNHANLVYDNYFKHISNLLLWASQANSKKNVLYSLAIEGMQHLVFFAAKTRRKTELKEYFKELLEDDDLFEIRHSLINLILDTKKFFDVDDFQPVIDKLIFDLEKLKKDNQRIRVLGIGQRIDNKYNLDSYNWFYEIAKTQEYMAVQQGGVGGLELISSALKAYESSGSQEDIQRANKIYEEFKKSDFLNLSKNEIDITNTVKEVNGLIEELKNQSLTELIGFIALSPDIVPNLKSWDEAVQQVIEFSPIRMYSTNIIYDRNGNVSERYIGPNNSIELFKKETFSSFLRFSLEIVINRLLPLLYSPDKWQFEDVVIELSKGWYGQEITRNIKPGQPYSFRIIELILPGLRSYYEGLAKYASDSSCRPDFTLTVDSLAVKLEALLRILCRAIGIRTTIIKTDEYDKEIVREKDINTLLREERLTEVLKEPMVQMLKTVLIERVGLNLRNRVAHGFILPIEYKGFHLANCLVFLIIRLSIWRLRDEEE